MWLAFHHFLRALSRTNHRKTLRRPRVATIRPRLEALEDRTLLSAYVVTTTADSGAGSLRDAITQVNADTSHTLYASPSNPSVDEIDFNITAASDTGGGFTATTGVATIKPQSVLPKITNAVIINGYSQSGANENTLSNGDNAVLKIVFNGANVPGTDYIASAGLVINAINSTVEGLAINGFGGSQIYATGNNDTFQGNFIGTNVSGTTTPFTPNLAQNSASDHAGIQITGAANVIGTNGNGVNDPAERNVIAGENYGVILRSTSNSVVAGNLIGTDASGTNALPNWVGIGTLLGANGDRIGTNGTDADVAGEGNLISGNAVGIAFGAGGSTPSETNGLVAGNSIGLDVNGKPLGNTRAGIFVGFSSSAITIGGNQANLANTIAHTQSGPGIWIVNLAGSPTGIRIQGNSIHDNSGLGIDLGGSYPTPPTTPLANDSAGHVGPNNFQNFPVLNSAISSSSDTSITGTFSEASQPNTTITLDFYANSTADPSGYGEGQTYLGSTQVTTDANGNASFSVDFGTGNLSGEWISATATDPSRNTSEFSADIQATATPVGQTYNSAYLQSLLLQSSATTNALTIQTGPNLTEDSVLSAVNGLTAPSQAVTITLNLNGGTYNDATVNPPANVTLVINGASSSNTFMGHSPAFTVTGGNVIISNVTFTTATDAPTILVTGGKLTLRNDTIQESTGATAAAIAITGGTVDLGTAFDPGGNVINANGSGEFVHNTTANVVSAVGDTFKVNGVTQTAASLSFTALTSSAAATTLAQTVTLTATVRANGSSATPTGSVDFFDTTTNTDLGSATLSGGVATLPTSALTAGNHAIVATYSGDATFLPSLDTTTQSVHYNFSGFLPPLNSNLSIGIGRTVPIKFQLTDANGNAITSLSAVTSLQIQALDANGNPVGAPFNPTPTGGTALRNDGGQYIFNWQTKGLTAGSYEIVLALNDGTTQVKKLQLTASHGSAGLETDAAGGTDSAGLGGLLGGDVQLYVDNSNGDLTSDELSRINDAVAAVDTTLAPFGVTVRAVSDPTQANATLNMDTTSSVGGFANGVLGCTTAAGQVTLIQGWNWYAGSDPSKIAAGQYDFETAVVHELGHVLGLGHSSDATSAMYATLATGSADRTLISADLNVPDTDSGACALHAAVTAVSKHVSDANNTPGMTLADEVSMPDSGNSSSAVDQVFSSADLTRLLTDTMNNYQSEAASLVAMWQRTDALLLQRFDALLSMGAGSRTMDMSNNTMTRDLLFAGLSSPNER